MPPCSLVYLLLLPVLCFTGSKSLKDVKINVPQAVIRGRDVALQCSFDMEAEKLYSLKWYRETSEFYRYSPMNNPPVQIFPVDGIKVNSRESRPIRIILEDVSREISGSFSCEVTAEMPSYYTIMHTAVLKVVDLPRTEPYITGLKRAYSPGDILNANCTSEFSYPPANITWHINGFHVRNHVLSQRIAGNNNRSAVVSHVRYRLPKKPSPGGIKVQCTAEIYDVYLRSTAFTVELTDYPDWPPTTRAPTTSTEEYYDTYDNFEIHPSDSPSSLWWFLLPFSCASTTSLSLFSIAFMVLAIVFS